MADSYGWNGDGRKVFDSALLEEAAAQLRRDNTGEALLARLEATLLPAEAFGKIPGGYEAHTRLSGLLTGLRQELGNVGIDLADLASRALAAAEMADEAQRSTWAAAGRGRMT